MKIAISSGHSTKCRGASDIIDEVDEATRVVDTVASMLFDAGIEVEKYHDTVSDDQSENLNRIVDWHNARTRDLDVSVHFNAYEHTSKPMGTECLYITQQKLAADVASAVSDAGDLINRGPKKRTDLFFLNNTAEPAVLIEVAFVDSQADVDLYRENFRWICDAIASALAGQEIVPAPEPEPEDALFQATGTCSWFGGPDDDGVSASEDLAWLETWDQVVDAGLEGYFLPTQPSGTSGLARRLDPDGPYYCACRWDYDVTPKSMLKDKDIKALVRANGRELLAQPIDWGPHEAETGRAADLSPGLMEALGIATDDEVEVIYPAPADIQPEPGERAVVKLVVTGLVDVLVNGDLVYSGQPGSRS